MNQTENPLEQLRDIHLPDPVDHLQLAPGWWFLIALIIIGFVYWLYRVFKKRKALALLKPIAREISELEKLPATGDSVGQLSELIKRVALIYFSKSQVASLSGVAWVKFLNSQQPAFAYSDAEAALFSKLVYQKDGTIEQTEWQSLVKKSHRLLEHIVRSQVDNRANKRGVK